MRERLMMKAALMPQGDFLETFGSAELSLFASEDEEIRQDEILPAVNGLASRLRRGTYSPLIAETAFFIIATRAANKYERRHGTGRAMSAADITCFTHEDRKRAALMLLRQHEELIRKAAVEMSV